MPPAPTTCSDRCPLPAPTFGATPRADTLSAMRRLALHWWILIAMGLDPVWLGVMIGLNIQTSFLTPPFGFALFYLRGVAPSAVTTQQIYRGVIPFVVIQLGTLLLLALFPVLAAAVIVVGLIVLLALALRRRWDERLANKRLTVEELFHPSTLYFTEIT